MTDPIQHTLTLQLNKIVSLLKSKNLKGNLEGLYAHQMLHDDEHLHIDWQVSCAEDDWIKEKSGELTHQFNVASLGFSIGNFKKSASTKHSEFFLRELSKLKKRDLFPGDHTTFPFIPKVFLGIVVGIKSIGDLKDRDDNLRWLLTILDRRRKKGGISRFNELFYAYIESLLKNEPAKIITLHDTETLEELTFIEWGARKGYFDIPNPTKNLADTRKKLLGEFVKTDLEEKDFSVIPLLWNSVNNTITESISEIVLSTNHVILLLNRFEDSLRRWRWDEASKKDPINWPIKNEREVQDIVWLILRSNFEDVIDEEYLPKFGHGASIPDFAIPSLGLLIEVKFVRKKGDFKKVEDEIKVDTVDYLTHNPTYNKIIVFIYDHSCSVQEHSITVRDLKKISGVEDVIIVSKPSQLPETYH